MIEKHALSVLRLIQRFNLVLVPGKRLDEALRFYRNLQRGKNLDLVLVIDWCLERDLLRWRTSGVVLTFGKCKPITRWLELTESGWAKTPFQGAMRTRRESVFIYPVLPYTGDLYRRDA